MEAAARGLVLFPRKSPPAACGTRLGRIKTMRELTLHLRGPETEPPKRPTGPGVGLAIWGAEGPPAWLRPSSSSSLPILDRPSLRHQSRGDRPAAPLLGTTGSGGQTLEGAAFCSSFRPRARGSEPPSPQERPLPASRKAAAQGEAYRKRLVPAALAFYSRGRRFRTPRRGGGRGSCRRRLPAWVRSGTGARSSGRRGEPFPQQLTRRGLRLRLLRKSAAGNRPSPLYGPGQCPDEEGRDHRAAAPAESESGAMPEPAHWAAAYRPPR